MYTFPWCIKKCPYCDFNSHELRAPLDQKTYLNALIRDLDYDLAVYDLANKKLSSIFLGGGTPSLFSGDTIARLLREIETRISFDDAIEITLETNPGAVEHDDFAAYRDAGVNRLSIGAQSFDDAQLQQLGRIHNAAEIHAAINAASAAGFTNLNLDLMYGLPNQTRQAARHDLQTAIAHAPAHLSLYQLTIEPNTLFYRKPPALPAHDNIAEIEIELHDLARENGYQRYEISAHAKPGKQCRHNLNYWQFGDYLAIGAGAHGKITTATAIKRYWKQKHPKTYLQNIKQRTGKQIGATSEIKDNEILQEFLMNALRLTDGFDNNQIKTRTNKKLTEATALLDDAITKKLITKTNKKIQCTKQGLLFLDEILTNLRPN